MRELGNSDATTTGNILVLKKLDKDETRIYLLLNVGDERASLEGQLVLPARRVVVQGLYK